PTETLLHTLRNNLGLTGSKPGCENGDCGACTALVDGRPMKTCLVLTVEAAHYKITTIEGLKESSIQQAFEKKFAFQCGYCTSGIIMNFYDLSMQYPNNDKYEIKNRLHSNNYLYTRYEEIEQAIQSIVLSDKAK